MLLSVINMLHGKLLLINPSQCFAPKRFQTLLTLSINMGIFPFFISCVLGYSPVLTFLYSFLLISEFLVCSHPRTFFGFFSLNKGLSYISSNTWLTSLKLHNIRYEIDILTHCCEKKLFDNCSLGAFTTLMDYTLIQTIYGICVSYEERVAKSNW